MNSIRYFFILNNKESYSLQLLESKDITFISYQDYIIKRDNEQIKNHTSLNFLNMMKIINWEKFKLKDKWIDKINQNKNFSKLNDDNDKKSIDYMDYYNAIITEKSIEIPIEENQEKILKDNLKKIQNVLESINKLTKVEGGLSVDITNLFILSMVNILAALFTFLLRNYTGNWEIDMNIFFLVKFLIIFLIYFLEGSIWNDFFCSFIML